MQKKNTHVMPLSGLKWPELSQIIYNFHTVSKTHKFHGTESMFIHFISEWFSSE